MSAFKVQRSAVAKTAAGSYGSTAVGRFVDQPARLPSFELDRQTADTRENPDSARSRPSLERQTADMATD